MGEGYTQTKYVFEFPIVDPLSVGVHVEALWINGRTRQETMPKAAVSLTVSHFTLWTGHTQLMILPICHTHPPPTPD